MFFIAGLLDTIASTAESKDCPGHCVHAFATIVCYDVLEEVECPSPSMRCCLDAPLPNTTQKFTTPATSVYNNVSTMTATTSERTSVVSTTSKTVSQ